MSKDKSLKANGLSCCVKTQLFFYDFAYLDFAIKKQRENLHAVFLYR